MCATITDNGSNFVKAFTAYSDSASETVEDTELKGEDVVFEDMDELFSVDPEETNIDDDLTKVQYDLRPHTATHFQRALLCGTKQADQSSFRYCTGCNQKTTDCAQSHKVEFLL